MAQEQILLEKMDLVRLRLYPQNLRLVNTRREWGLTQKQLADILECQTWRISQLETLRLVDEKLMSEVADFFQESVDYLFPEALVKAIRAGTFSARVKDLPEPVVMRLSEVAERRLITSDEGLSEDTDRWILRERIEDVLLTLDPQERRVLELRFGLGDSDEVVATGANTERTLRYIGFILNLSGTRIGQIEAKALRKLRHPSRCRYLKDFLP